MSVQIPITLIPIPEYRDYSERHIRTDETATEGMAQEGYLRVPIWVIVLLITIAGGLILNGAATVYWAATFKQSFSDFKDETYKQKTEHLEDEITRLQIQLKAEQDRRQADVDLLTERQNDTRLRLAGKGIFTK